MGIRVTAVDNVNNERNYAVAQGDSYVIVALDQNIPSVGDLKVVQYSDFSKKTLSKERNYEGSMYISNNIGEKQWYLTGPIKDDGSISIVTCTAEQGSDFSLETADVTYSSSLPFTSKNTDTLTFYVKLPSTNTASGKLYAQLTVTDEKGHSNQQYITINLDNTAPSLYNTSDAEVTTTTAALRIKSSEKNVDNSSNPITNSNKICTFGDTVKEADSGLSFIAFYFMKTVSSKRVYCPMVNSSTAGDDVPATMLTEKPTTLAVGDMYVNDDKLACMYLTGTRVDSSNVDSTTSFKNADYIKDTAKNIRKGGLIKIGGIYTSIKNVDTTNGIITFNDAVSTSFKTAEVIFAQIVDHKIKESVSSSDATIVDPDSDDGDGMIETITSSGSSNAWTASIKSDYIADGPIELHIVAMDTAGNISNGYVKTAVQNNRPRIAKVLLGTDLNGNGKYDFDGYTAIVNSKGSGNTADDVAFGEFNYYSTLNRTTGESSYDATLASTGYAIKSGMCVIPEFTSGNGSVIYTLQIGSTKGTYATTEAKSAAISINSAKSLNMISKADMTKTYVADKKASPTVAIADTITDYGAIVLTTANITGNCKESTSSTDYKYFTFTFWDDTEDTNQGTSSQNALLNIPVIVDLVDDVAPKTTINPFFWNSASSNSLYSNSSKNGHIELTDDLDTTTFNVTNTTKSGEYDNDPKVSGKITLRGYAYDDVRLSSLWAYFGDVTGTAYLTTSSNFGTAGVNTVDSKSYYEMAEYSPSMDAWTSATGTVSGASWKFTVYTETPQNETASMYGTNTDPYFNQKGHKVFWQLDIDTSSIGNVADNDIYARVIAVDHLTGTGNSSVLTTSGTANDDASYNVPYYKMDVVPYITAIHTTNRTESGLKDNNIRSASGKYSVMYNSTCVADFITVEGFNLNPSAVVVVPAATVANTTVTASSGTSVDYTADSSYTKFTAKNSVAKSGYLEVFTNGIRSLNNINNNDSVGAFTTTDKTDSRYASYYNREPDYYKTYNTKLTDDRYLRFFDMKDTGVKNGYYPTMIMNSNNPVFGYVNLNGGPSTNVGTAAETGAGSYYPSHAMPQRAEFNGSTAAEVYTEYLIKASIWDQMGMAVDEGGRYYNVSVYNRDSCAMSFIYDRYAELYTSGMGWGAATGYESYYGNWSQNNSNNAITLERTDYKDSLLLGRYQYPKLIAKGNSKTGAAKIYMSYYDDNTGEIIFRNFQIGKTVSGKALDSSKSDNDGTTYAQKYNFNENTSNSSTWNTGRLTAVSSGGSKYYSMGVTSDAHVVLVYYNEEDGKMYLQYSADVVDGSTPTNAIDWTTSSVSFPDYVGTYVSMAIDSKKGIHIAAFDAGDSNLVYMYLSSYSDTTLESVTVDQAFSVGNWTQIKVKGTTPYIAYYNSTETGSRDSIKLAYCNTTISEGNVLAGVDSKTGYTTGNWEYMTVPAITPPQGGSTNFQNVCLDFDTSNNPVIGYLGTDLEFGKWLSE